MGANSTNATCVVDNLQCLSYSPLFVLGFLVNAAAARAFASKRLSWTETHIYMLNLVVADTALVLFLPFRIYDALYCLPTTTLCTLLIFIHFINMYASIMTTMAISVHRYLTVRFPLQARSWRRKKETAVVVCLLIWVFLVTVCAAFRTENYPEQLWTCYVRRKDHPLRLEFLLILLLVGFLVPLMIIVFCATQIIYILSKEEDRLEEKKKTVGVVMANMIVFIVCYTPIHVGFLINFLYHAPEHWQTRHIPAHMYFQVSEWVASTNCFFDSISYYFLLKQFYS
ncbi:G-protein coupled receptor 35 [Betta splendens]|uniref:G-protein coupled receptor 35 n=1 Tax=Betta splendens TaxID=158456 RepID=A0A6P7KY70_BETSP|nr:G-protein coupled receptor 35 [Betta splendens]XP_055359905.1 G-protein coupled receptor 35 [Betta splendens]